MFYTEFQRIRDGIYFGLKRHPSRESAEAFAVEELVRLGEARSDAVEAASMAGWSCADASAHGYGVRIFEEA